jgi:hypothetical protein
LTIELTIFKKVSAAASKDKPLMEDSTDPNLHIPLEEHKHYHEIQSLRQELLETQDTHTLRLKYTFNIFIIICTWLAFVIVGVFFSGFKLFNFSLSDKVLIAFITSTTISVLGLFIVVAKWMFPNNQSKENRKI